MTERIHDGIERQQGIGHVSVTLVKVLRSTTTTCHSAGADCWQCSARIGVITELLDRCAPLAIHTDQIHPTHAAAAGDSARRQDGA